MKSLFIILLSTSSTLLLILWLNRIFVYFRGSNAKTIYNVYKIIIEVILLPVPIIMCVWYIYTNHNVTTTLFTNNQSILVNKTPKWQLVISFVWAFGVLFLALWHIIYYIRWHKSVISTLENAEAYEYCALQEAKNKLKCKLFIKVCYSNMVKSPISTGLRNLYIILPKEKITNPKILQMIFEHELHHFLSKDLWHKLLLLILKMLFWFNPLIYIFSKKFSFWCEIATDAQVIKDIGEDERKSYALTILSFIPDYQDTHIKNHAIIALSFFYKEQKDLKRRIYYIMKKKDNKKTHLISVFAILFSFLVSSTVSVYAATANDGIAVIDHSADTENPSNVCYIMDINSEAGYTGNPAEEQSFVLLYPKAGYDYIILRDGLQIPWTGVVDEARFGCTHDKIDVSVTEHKKNSNGSCLTILYKAQQCIKCGVVWKVEELGRMTLNTCPH